MRTDDAPRAVASIESGCPDDSAGFTRYVTTEGGGADVGFIASPNYPQKYFRNARCRWRLAAQRTQTVRLTLVDFELDVRRNGVCHDQLRVIATVSVSDHVIFSDCGALGKQVTVVDSFRAGEIRVQMTYMFSKRSVGLMIKYFGKLFPRALNIILYI